MSHATLQTVDLNVTRRRRSASFMPVSAAALARGRPEAVIDALVDVARPVIRRRWRANSCIASTAVAVDVLAHYGIHAREVPVRVAVLNSIATRLLDRNGQMPATEQEARRWNEAGSWVIRLQPSSESDTGHLVALAAGRLVDLAIDQAARPQRGLPVEPLAVPAPAGWPDRERVASYRSNTDASICYESDLAAGDYLASPDWADASRRHGTVAAVIAAVDRRLT